MQTEKPFSRALKAPTSEVTTLNAEMMKRVVEGSRNNPRKRVILPLHKTADASLHRMLNGMQPYSYIQPHRHLHPPKAESVIVLQGAIFSFVFNATGDITEVQTLTAGGANFGVDSEPGIFHTFLALEKDTVLFEVKPGPYEQNSDKDFAAWAPREGSEETAGYMNYLYDMGKRNR
jgi:cupin fold WbuC family metalloprotein